MRSIRTSARALRRFIAEEADLSDPRVNVVWRISRAVAEEVKHEAIPRQQAQAIVRAAEQILEVGDTGYANKV